MTQDAFYAKLFHVVVVLLIALYVVFVQKSESTVESVSSPDKVTTPSRVDSGSNQKG